MKTISITPGIMVDKLLSASRDIGLCLLDSCGAGHPGSKMLFAGANPSKVFEISDGNVYETFQTIDRLLTGNKPAIFTLSYDFGRRIHHMPVLAGAKSPEPDLFIAVFDSLFIHDYLEGRTFVTGDTSNSVELLQVVTAPSVNDEPPALKLEAISTSLAKNDYLNAVESIKDHIRRGNTYQTNLTQKLTTEITNDLSAQTVFKRIRRDNPVPFTAFLERKNSTVVSASPERFFKREGDRILASPIKGTRPRGFNKADDDRLRFELLQSEKDRAENIMIVDLLRNDLGRVCEFGSVFVDEICSLQELPSVFHLVSTIEGKLTANVRPSQIIEALFPCGSITGAPKLRSMQIIDEIEPVPRGLSMGAIGIYVPEGFGVPPMLDLSVAIRTIVIQDRLATFNVGGGIVIDSDAEKEYDESLTKAHPLLSALGILDMDKKLM